MKKKIIFFILSVIAMIFTVAYIMPPELPSSFYGIVKKGELEQVITTNFNGSTETMQWENKIVYSINITGGKEGDIIYFYVNGTMAGFAIYHVGTNQNVDLKIFNKNETFLTTKSIEKSKYK